LPTRIRKSPAVCLCISIIKLVSGKLRYSRKYHGTLVKMDDGHEYTIFRHISNYPIKESKDPTVFIVSFKFARLTHKANKIASIIPMLLITGFPGFHMKMYAVNRNNGYWQEKYQWESKQALEDYKKSFVFMVMNKRVINRSIISIELNNHQLIDYIKKKDEII